MVHIWSTVFNSVSQWSTVFKDLLPRIVLLESSGTFGRPLGHTDAPLEETVRP